MPSTANVTFWSRSILRKPRNRRKSLKNGAPCATRTHDHLIKSQMLYQLS